MGSFYNNIHLRTTDRPAVERVWHAYWEERQEPGWTFISPVYGGWVSVFDWRCDQQDVDVLSDLASYFSRRVGCTALAFQVYDSDLAQYWLFRGGDEVDHYTSDTEYFAAFGERADVTPEEGVFDGYGPDVKAGYPLEEDRSDGGNTALLTSLLDTRASDIELEAILRTPAYIADDILTALASAIGINDSWAALGYHYLVSERSTIHGFEAFTHLPADQPPNRTRFIGEH